MCGITGFTGRTNPELIRNMCRALVHRGPDDEGYLDSPAISLGMRRLAIVDRWGGRQPIANEDGSVVTVFNGEIYNHAGIRSKLEAAGHRFATHHCDTEIVVHAYEQYGDLWPEMATANGMFGLAIWDEKRRRLLLYRDRLGKKPLYYAKISTGIAFASEIKALLLHPEVSSEWDYVSLYRYMGLKHSSAPLTAYKQIRQLLPGHYLSWSEEHGIQQPKQYWRLDFTPADSALLTDENAIAEHILSLLTNAVRLRMDCDVSYGAFLSGGIDSSAVAVLMARHQVKPLKTFCLGYADLEGGQQSGKSQDVQFSQMMANRLSTEHHEHIITAEDFIRDFPKVVQAMDEPFSGTVSTYYLAKYMHEHITVAVSGDGADELFGSYLAHRLAFPMEAWRKLKMQGKENIKDLSPNDLQTLEPFDSAENVHFLSQIALPSLTAWRQNLDVFSHEERCKLLTPEFLEAAGMSVNKNPYVEIETVLTAKDELNRCLEIDQHELLPNQVLPFVDRLSMAHSVEVRCPFLDYALVGFVNSLPGTFKIRGSSTKHILRKALTSLLPQELLSRPKEGFVQPVFTWLRGPLRKFASHALAALPKTMVKPEVVQLLMKRFHDGDQSVNAKVWNLICLSVWASGVEQ